MTTSGAKVGLPLVKVVAEHVRGHKGIISYIDVLEGSGSWLR